MFYVVKSSSKSLRDKIINKILETNKIEKDNLIIFDFEEKGDFEKSFSEYLTLNFDGEKKMIVLKNSTFLNLVKPEKNHEERFGKSIDIKNTNIIVFDVDKLNSTGKLNKKFKSKFELVEKEPPINDELIKFVEHFFSSRNIKITFDLSKRITERLKNDFDMIVSEIRKLELVSKGTITNEMIDSFIIDLSKENIFKLAGLVMTLDEQGVSKIIKQLRSQGEGFYLIGERLAVEFSRALRYKIISESYGMNNDFDFQKSTKWNLWAIKNYSKWIKNWSSQKEMADFFYEIILRKCFFDIVEGNPDDPLKLLEKILISNIIKIKKGRDNESK